MKKVYSKFTKERGKAFRIETAIYQGEDGEREVRKRPVSRESEAHVKRMYENYEYFRTSALLLPCRMEGTEAVFPFVAGKSYYHLILETAEKRDREGLFRILDQYAELVKALYPVRKPFEATAEFEGIFGLSKPFLGLEAAEKLNIDLTFDNIMLQDGKIQILDYEWIFDFPVPVNYAIYRAVYALFVKNRNQFQEFIEEEEIYQRLGISKNEQKWFFSMNKAFMWYVEGGESSYTRTLQAYEKPILSMEIAEARSSYYSQIFWDTGKGYTEEQCENFLISKGQTEVFLEKNLEGIEGLQEVRIDPLNVSVLIEGLLIVVDTGENGVRRIHLEEMQTNRKWFVGSTLLFEAEDPQILIRVPEGETWKKIRVEYKICRKRLENLRLYKEVLDNEFAERQRKLQEKLEEQNQLLKEGIGKLEQQEKLLRLYRDKLAYIESSKFYKGLLKSKVDKQKLWEELE